MGAERESIAVSSGRFQFSSTFGRDRGRNDCRRIRRWHIGEFFKSRHAKSRETIRAIELLHKFLVQLSSMPSGAALEIGSRARSGVTRRHFLPASTWAYTGMDILAGENVDVVGDAHKLSKLFPEKRFRAVMSFSVLEHLLMPWKFAIELNRVMELGGVGFLHHASMLAFARSTVGFLEVLLRRVVVDFQSRDRIRNHRGRNG